MSGLTRVGVAIVLMVCAPGRGWAATPKAKSHHWVAYPVDAYQPNFEPRVGQPTVDVPEVIGERLEQEVRESHKYWRHEAAMHDADLLEFPLSDYYGPLVRLNAPHDRWLFVFELRGPVGTSELLLLLDEPATGRISPTTLRLPNKWTSDFAVKHPKPDDLLQEPYLGFGDLDDDGEAELVVERYGHNGTMYNAALEYVFSIQSDLSLAPLLVLEARVNDIGYVSDAVSGDIEREFVSLGAGRGRLLVTWVAPRHRTVELGEVDLIRDGPELPFRVADVAARRPVYELILVGFDVDGLDLAQTPRARDDLFLEEGYGFEY